MTRRKKLSFSCLTRESSRCPGKAGNPIAIILDYLVAQSCAGQVSRVMTKCNVILVRKTMKHITNAGDIKLIYLDQIEENTKVPKEDWYIYFLLSKQHFRVGILWINQ